ncbi:MAG: ROK family protein [Ruminococcus sp.]|nr:ROK family protein [Ruminococcus sp.]
MEQHGISKLDLKRRNRMQVLKILKTRGPTSRIDIAGTLELTRAAVTIITNEMIEQGIIQEIGEYRHVSEKAPRGRKKILIDINHHYKFVVGVSIEENLLSVGLSTLSGAVLDKRNVEITSDTKYERIEDFIASSVKEILSDNCLTEQNILGIGFGIFPTMYERLGIKMVDAEPDYSTAFAKVREFTQLPLVFDNSVKGTAMANIDFQKTKDLNRHNIAFLHYGNTIHFVVTNLNEPIVSYDNRTNFVDKMIINPNADTVCECGRRGCVENELTPIAVARKIKAVFSAQESPFLYEAARGNFDNVNADMLIAAYEKGEKSIVDIINERFRLTAVLLNNLYFSTNPQKIVLHNFNFRTEAEFQMLKSAVTEIGGALVASKVELSIIEDKHRFLSGCALAIRELFFNKGGFDTPKGKQDK